MAFIAVSGEPGCRHEEFAAIVAQRLGCGLVTEFDLNAMIAARIPAHLISQQFTARAWRPLAALSLAGVASANRHVVISATGVELLAANLPSMFRCRVVAPKSTRLANLMGGGRLNKAGALVLLRRLVYEDAKLRKLRGGPKMPFPTNFDVILNAQSMPVAMLLDTLIASITVHGLLDAEPLAGSALAKVQFEAGLQLASLASGRHGLDALASTSGERKPFGHPSEEVFASLLDFYRIAWDYEPRSFPLQWDKDGKVSEAFTPDFYLPDFDLYVELTTMKQANVTKKNRKVRLLRNIYPHINIEIFYQKDIHELIMRYRLPERLAAIDQVR